MVPKTRNMMPGRILRKWGMRRAMSHQMTGSFKPSTALPMESSFIAEKSLNMNEGERERERVRQRDKKKIPSYLCEISGLPK